MNSTKTYTGNWEDVPWHQLLNNARFNSNPSEYYQYATSQPAMFEYGETPYETDNPFYNTGYTSPVMAGMHRYGAQYPEHPANWQPAIAARNQLITYLQKGLDTDQSRSGINIPAITENVMRGKQGLSPAAKDVLASQIRQSVGGLSRAAYLQDDARRQALTNQLFDIYNTGGQIYSNQKQMVANRAFQERQADKGAAPWATGFLTGITPGPWQQTSQQMGTAFGWSK